MFLQGQGYLIRGYGAGVAGEMKPNLTLARRCRLGIMYQCRIDRA
jgi:hypothetical protein